MSPQATPSTSHDLSGMRILLIDDEDDSLEIASTILERAGARVHGFSNAQAAFSTLESIDPDVIVSDIGMPIEDGYSFIRRVRASSWPKARSIPAIAVTAYTTASDRNRALTSGFTAHLGKPVAASSLIEAVSGALTPQSPHR